MQHAGYRLTTQLLLAVMHTADSTTTTTTANSYSVLALELCGKLTSAALPGTAPRTARQQHHFHTCIPVSSCRCNQPMHHACHHHSVPSMQLDVMAASFLQAAASSALGSRLATALGLAQQADSSVRVTTPGAALAGTHPAAGFQVWKG